MSQNAVKPLLLGYQAVTIGSAQGETTTGRLTLQRFADREGYCLGEIFIERDSDHPGTAMAGLIAVCQHIQVAAIAVSCDHDLGRFPPAQHRTRERLQRECGVPVLVASPASYLS